MNTVIHLCRRLPLLICLFALAVLCSSCASSRRAMRISPFGEPTAVGGMGGERVNVWPLAYRDSDSVSLLWPFVDWDDQGFAIRPLYNREGDDQSILFPLSGWNARRGHGWVGLGYYDSGVYGLFPFLHVGKSTRWVAPIWWHRARAGTDAYGAFPLWSQRHMTSPGKTDLRLGMGLLARYRREADDDRLLWLAPAYYSRRSSSDRFQALFPFWFSADRAVDDRSTRALLPLFANFRKGEDKRTLVTPLYFEKTDSDSLLRLALPAYIQRHREDEKLLALPPLFMYSADPRSKMLVTPLGGRGWTPAGETFMRNLAGPVYHWRRSQDESFTAVLWPFYQQRTDFRTFKATSWPLLTTLERESGQTRKLIILAGAWYQDDENRCALWGTQRWLTKDGRTSWHAWPLMSSLRHPQADVSDPLFNLSLINTYRFDTEHGTLITPFFGYLSTRGQRQWRAWPLYGYREQFNPSVERHHLLTLGYHESREGERRTGIWPLFSLVDSERTTHPRFLERLSLLSLCQGRSNWDHTLGFGLLGYSRGYADGETSRVERSALLVANRRAWQRDPQAAIEAWSRSYGYSSAGNVKTSGWNLFPLAFRDEREFLNLFADDKKLLSTCRQWMSLDAARHGDPQKVAKAEAELSEVLAGHPGAGRLLAEAAPLAGRERAGKIRAALAVFAWDHATQARQARFHMPLIFRSRRENHDVAWSFLFGAANYRRTDGDSRLSILRYLYRREKTDERIYRDMFPFLTWNSRADGGDFSFAWRLVNIERRAGRTRGHLFFFPWGDSLE